MLYRNSQLCQYTTSLIAYIRTHPRVCANRSLYACLRKITSKAPAKELEEFGLAFWHVYACPQDQALPPCNRIKLTQYVFVPPKLSIYAWPQPIIPSTKAHTYSFIIHPPRQIHASIRSSSSNQAPQIPNSVTVQITSKLKNHHNTNIRNKELFFWGKRLGVNRL
jgi:hypothetical protein